MKGLRCAALAGLAIAATSCDSGRSAGGSFETENVSAFEVSVDSLAPAARRLGWTSYVATVRLDSQVYDFGKNPEAGDLVVEKLDGTALPFAIHRWEAKAKWARIQVRLEGELLRRGARFRIRSGIVLLPLSDSAGVWSGIPARLQEEWTSVLVDDFESGANSNLLPAGNPWFTQRTDSTSISDPQWVGAGPGRPGQALKFDYVAPQYAGYVLLATELASHPVNFASLDSIVFWAKGQGILSVSLDHKDSVAGSKTWMHDDLDSNWTRWRVRPQDFDPPSANGGNHGWDSVHDSVTTLSFFASTSGTVMLDDIRFFGLHEDDFR